MGLLTSETGLLSLGFGGLHRSFRLFVPKFSQPSRTLSWLWLCRFLEDCVAGATGAVKPQPLVIVQPPDFTTTTFVVSRLMPNLPPSGAESFE